MIEPLLRRQLDPAVRRFRRQKVLLTLLVCWGVCALVIGAVWVGGSMMGVAPPRDLIIIAIGACVAVAGVAWLRAQRWQPDYRNVARHIELHHPELHAVLLTAVEQRPDASTGQYSYLQQRVIQDAVAGAGATKWVDAVPQRRLAALEIAHWTVLAAFMALVVATFTMSPAQVRRFILRNGVEVSPGDVSLERGSPLVVLARFDGRVPSEATLLVDAQNQPGQRIPLVKNLDDPTFGGTLPTVTGDLVYSVSHDGKETPKFRVVVFDFPKLERADARVAFPDYTGKPETEIKDTRRVSAVEGSRLNWTLHLNKPVASASLVTKDKTVVSLLVDTNDAVATLADFVLKDTKSYQLQLVDREGRTNKMPAQFVFEALSNRAPEIKLTAPRGDQRLSPLEEINFAGQIWDDFGLNSYGLTYTVAGQEPVSIALGEAVPGAEKRSFAQMLKLESLGVTADQLVSWFVWADDIGPDGEVRRTSSDMYFAEVRPFEEIFRQGDGMEGMQGQGGGAGNQSLKLADLQKQIINATWKLQRREQGLPSAQYRKDAPVVLESQERALEQARTLRARALDPRTQGLWNTVEEEMTEAVEQLTSATNNPSALPAALSAEQSAYQALLRIAGREFLVTRNRNRGGGGGGGGEQRNQQQLDQLEFKGEDNRYETQSQASPAQSAEQREQLGVLSRLKELAQRQQDMNDRLKELQTALQAAKTEKQREELQRELKRLRDEEQELLADVDELMQRMSRPQNQEQMSDARRELEKTRSEIQRAAEALSKESVAEALTSGTRAERDLEQLRDDFRKKNSSQFAEDMRRMRTQARELARNQQEIGEKLNAESERKSLSESEDMKALAEQLQQQFSAVTNLLDDAQRVSEQAETSEPLLSKQLYDTLRRASQDDAGRAKQALTEAAKEGTLSRSLYDRLREIDKSSRAKSLESTAELLRNSLTPQARSAEQRARGDIDNLKRGLEKAAESVLGDDTEALRMAQNELDQLTQEVEREMAQQFSTSTNGIGSTTDSQDPSAQRQRGDGGTNSQQLAQLDPAATNLAARAGSSARSGNDASSEQPGEQPGARGERSQANAGQQAQQGQQPGGENQGGRSEAQSQTAQAQRQGQSGEAQGEAQGRQQSDSQNAQARNGGGGRSGGPFRLRREALDSFFNSGDGGGHNDQRGPLTGENFQNWSERLGNVEEMVDNPDLRTQIARIRDRARNIRTDVKKHAKSPQWSLVQSQVINPLHEVRTRVAEELARRESNEAIVPLDRDPVPTRFSELVRRYYEKLGQE